MPNTFIVCDDAVERQMEAIRVFVQNYRPLYGIRLYKSTMTPSHSSVIADFVAVEADFSGYEAKEQNYGTVVLADNKATTTDSIKNWMKDGATGNDIYGYFVNIDVGGAILVGAEQFPSPVSMNTNGQTISLQSILSTIDKALANPASSDFVVANEFSLSVAEYVLRGELTCLYGATMHLFKSDITPSASDTVATYSGDEADFSGYASQGVTWNTAIQVGDQARIPADLLVWTKNGATGNTIYGYYMLTSGGDLIGAKKYDTTAPMMTDGQQHTLEMVYTVESEK